LDGDGSSIMHLGSLGIIGSIAPANYIHIVLNNGAHDSVGGQPTIGLKINLPNIAKACGYKTAFSVNDNQSLNQILDTLKSIPKPVMLEVKVMKGARKDLGRPTISPIQNKVALMKYLKQ
jgi:phosphonopyruvate decarboxylase